MSTTLTILVENTVPVPAKGDGLYAEHGFALFLERPEIRILFDTGPAGGAMLHNAPRLGVNLATADAIVLSHGHMDHTGGLVGVLRAVAKPIPVYGHPAIFTDRYGKRGNDLRYGGLPYKREALEGMGAAFDLSHEFRQIAPGVHLTGEIPRRRVFETGDAHLYVKQNGELRKDPLQDDQSMVLETADGLALILGCCHAGLINTIDHVQAKLPGKPIHTILGGDSSGLRTPRAIAGIDRHPQRPGDRPPGPCALHRAACGSRIGKGVRVRRRVLQRRLFGHARVKHQPRHPCSLEV